jgi:diguanylate cyclase (GGDEF)-like protein/PAS domain S-box-containing protein
MQGLRFRAVISFVAGCLLWAALSLVSAPAAFALDPIVIGQDDEKIDITLLGEFYERRGDKISIETAIGSDGIASRMKVDAKTPGTNPNWVVFALSNPTDKPVLRWLTAQRYEIVGSRYLWPNLDAPRIANVTPSLGFRPERVEDYDQFDVFRISVEPGATVTFIVELSSIAPRLYLTTPAGFGKRQREVSLFQGVLLGIAGITAIFLTAIFAANHRLIFPASAIVAWSAVAYLCVDFGFWHKLFQLSSEDNATYRAGAEAAFAASLVIFLYIFLNLRLWHRWISIGFLGWVPAQLGLVIFALIDAQAASGIARLSFLPIAGVGSLILVFLALRGQERALSLLPSWMLFMVWLFAAAVAIQGRLSGDFVVSALSAGLVVFVMLIAFTVTQYAFQNADAGSLSEDAGQFKLRVMALEASGASIWEWDARKNEINTGPEVETALGLPANALRCPLDEWLQHLHGSDRERMRLTLWTVRERQGGEISIEFRMKRPEGGHLWYELRAVASMQRNSRSLRGVGLMRDITAQKRGQERLHHNAIRDGVTGLPNRELFLDRLQTAMARTRDENLKPTVFYIDLDMPKGPGRTPDFTSNDGILLTVARRLSRHLSPLDTLARLSFLQFGILVSSDTEPRHIAMMAERVRRALRTPIKAGNRDLVLTGSIGIAMYDGQQQKPDDLLREAESAMYRSKRAGTDRIELFKPEMRGESDERSIRQADLKHAIERRQIKVMYQPIMRIADERLAGFEAFVVWEHPHLGPLSLPEFETSAEAAGLTTELWSHIFERCIRQGTRWHRILQREDPLFLSINVSSQQLFHNDLIQNLRLIIGREALPKGALRLEVAESLVTANPEQAIEILDWLKSLNVSLALDEFGVSFSSLTYWHRMNIDAIKIDRSIVAMSHKDRASAGVMKAVMTIAHDLGKDVIAMGVDTEQDLGVVKAVGCEYGQGLFFSEMMTEKDVVALLNAITRSTKRDDRDQKREEKQALRRAERDKRAEEKATKKALAAAEALAKKATANAAKTANGPRKTIARPQDTIASLPPPPSSRVPDGRSDAPPVQRRPEPVGATVARMVPTAPPPKPRRD